MPWNIENYYVTSGRVLTVEVTIPLIDFLYVRIDDVKEAWFAMLRQFVNERPQYEVSWEMAPRDEDALVTIRIAKKGTLESFSREEVRDALKAADGLFGEASSDR